METTSDFENIIESICEKLNSNTLNDFDKANLMRLDLITSYHDLMSRSEDAAAKYIVEEHLKNYSPLVCNSIINNYAEQLKAFFSSSSSAKISTNWEPIQIDDINDLLPSDLNCKGEYENCKYNEIDDEDVKNFEYFKIHAKESTEISDTDTQLKSNNENFSDFFREDLKIPSTSFDVSQQYQKCQESSIKNEKFSFFSEFSKKTSSDNFNLNVQNIPKENQVRNYFPQKEENLNNNDNELTKKEFFRTATEELFIQNMKKNMGNSSTQQSQKPLPNYGLSKKSLGIRRGVRSNFVPPIKRTFEEMEGSESSSKNEINTEQPIDERLKNVDEKMIEMIKNEIMHKVTPINWDDIAGLEYAKSIIQEAVVWPLLRPDIFTGLRRPPRGILLFGPPGTGKTLIGKCIASQSKSTFFSISASSLTSKWVGEGEKMVRALFAVAAVHQPSVVFIDEIDSLLCQRSESEHESSRRIKTEFLVQLDGAATSEDERILIVGATNRPQELDEAARRRLVRRLYIPLPEIQARYKMLKNLLSSVSNELSDDEINTVSMLTDGYSGADMKTLCTEASMEPIRSIPSSQIPYFDKNNVRPVLFRDFETALKRVRASVSQDDLKQYIDWNNIYGSGNVS